MDYPFIPGIEEKREYPLDRYMPPLFEGVVAECLNNWLGSNVSKGSWVFDPFGASPLMALEAARCGYRVLVCANNPILSFMLEVMASTPRVDDLTAALAELSMMHHGEERLDLHLKSLYQTKCASCNQTIMAEAFLWKRGEQERFVLPQPYARIYHCPQCGDEGERSLTTADIEKLVYFNNSQGLHRARAVQRVDIGDEAVREGIRAALDTYLPRPLYFVSTLLNKIEGLNVKSDQRRLLTALLISTFDAANALWSFPNLRSRPRQLLIPPQFRENNLWMVLEEAIGTWGKPSTRVALTRFPELPPESGGICLYPGRSRDVLPLIKDISLDAAIFLFPRPNQAFWTLSAMWSGWLWGSKAVLPLKSALERQRYDWEWHRHALTSVLSPLQRYLPVGLPVFGILPEMVPGFLFAVMAAVDQSGYQFQGMAIQEEQKQAQFYWKVGKSTDTLKDLPTVTAQPVSDRVKIAIQDYLAQRNEPAQYLEVYAAGLASITRDASLGAATPGVSEKKLEQVQKDLENVIENSGLFIRYPETGLGIESCSFWLAHAPEIESHPLADRIEMEVVHLLIKSPQISVHDVQKTLCGLFPGLTAPSFNLMQACLESYAEMLPDMPGYWHLRSQEKPEARRSDLKTATLILNKGGQALKYRCEGESPLVWQNEEGQPVFCFYLTASSIVSQFVLRRDRMGDNAQPVVILPGSRARLLVYKLRADPRLAEKIKSNWHLLKLRTLRQVAARTYWTRSMWDGLLTSDPVLWEESTQMQML